MFKRMVHTVTVTGDAVEVGDVITVGGISHAVCDMREVSPQRRSLRFEDGNVYVLGDQTRIEVTRTYLIAARPRSWSAAALSRPMVAQPA